MANRVAKREFDSRGYRRQRQNEMVEIEHDSVVQAIVREVQNSQMRGRGRGLNKLKVVCQVCGKSGHIALHCCHRFDITYVRSVGVSSGFKCGQVQMINEGHENNAEANIG